MIVSRYVALCLYMAALHVRRDLGLRGDVARAELWRAYIEMGGVP